MSSRSNTRSPSTEPEQQDGAEQQNAANQQDAAERQHTHEPDAPEQLHAAEPGHGDDRAGMRLEPFTGVFTPGICFTSGHCVSFYRWSSSPTALDAYQAVIVIAPDGERRLYVDPVEAAPSVETYHAFDRTDGASVTWTRDSASGLEAHLDAADGTTLDLEIDLGSSTGTRVLTAVTALTPTSVLRTDVGGAVSNRSLALLLDANGLKVVGRTDTDEPYRVEADSLRAVADASATLNGTDLGDVSSPGGPLGFGDAKVPNDPFVAFGDLYLRPPTE